MTVWGVTKIGAVSSTFSGGTPSTARAEYYGGDIPWIASAELNQGRISSVKGRISKLGLDRSSAKLVEPGTPLIALYGATAGVPAIAGIRGAINQAVLAMVPKGIDAEFLFQWLKANRDQIIDRYTQGGQPNLSGAIVRSIEVPLPPLPEQRRIAGALRDADDLVAALERIIVKKQAIKHGMMQQLLTGRTRLPGFTDPWREVSIDRLAVVDPDALSASTDPKTRINYISLEDVSRGELLGSSELTFSVAPSRARRIVRDQDVLFGTVRPNLQSHLLYRGGLRNPVASTGFAVVRSGANAEPAFLFYLLMSDRAAVQIDGIIAGSNYPAVSSGDVRRLTFATPHIDEQRAISAVLLDTDEDITVLRSRLTKARAIKTGMMQQLLTGRTRLPVETAA